MNTLCRLWGTISARWLYLAGAAVIGCLYGAALYLQHMLHQDPCPLCMVQRLIYIVMAVFFVIAALHNPKKTGARVYAGIIGLVALFGMAVAGRHIWIQHMPKDEVPACGPGLDYMLENFPMADVLKELVHGSGECAERGWMFLTLGIPEWSFIWFTLLGIWAVMIAMRRTA